MVGRIDIEVLRFLEKEWVVEIQMTLVCGEGT